MNGFKFYPDTVVWEITFACNMRCLHCGTAAGKLRPTELTTQEALGLIDELADLGCARIHISGGEPLLREDWRELARHMNTRGIHAYLITNGYVVTENIVKDFKELQIRNVGVSFDGIETTHNYIRQNKESHRRALNAMRLMREQEVLFCAITQVSNLNLGELDQIRQTLIDAGCPAWRIQMTTCTGRMSRDLVLDLDNYPALIDKCLEYKKENSVIDIDVGENIGYYGCKGTELRDGHLYLGCYAGTRILGIESDGTVKGCLSMPEDFVEGNIRDSSLTAIWNNPEGFKYNRQFTRNTATGECHACKYLPLCRGGCTTTSWSATGQRANNPYCIYQIEQKQGIQPRDNETISRLLAMFPE